MATLRDVLAYILQQYPHSQHLSLGRLTKLVYLADWKHSIEQGSQITDIDWQYNHYGPYVEDVREALRSHRSLFKVDETYNSRGNVKYRISMRNPHYKPRLEPSEREALDHSIWQTEDLTWHRFIKLVYSTYPMLKVDQYDFMDLPVLAQEYKASHLFEPA